MLYQQVRSYNLWFLALLLSAAAFFLIPHAAYADTVIFEEDCASNPAQNLDASTNITVGTSWSSRITLAGAPAITIQSGTANCSPSAGATNVGIGYTTTPAPTTDAYYVDYLWTDVGLVSADAGFGILLNYIDANNYYDCYIKDDAAQVALIYKVSGGVGSTLSSAAGSVSNGQKLSCTIDYSGSSPVITFKNETTPATFTSVTDSSSPLTKTGGAGFACGATPAGTADDCTPNLDADTIRLTTIPNAGGGDTTASRHIRLFDGFKIKILKGGKITILRL